MATVPSTPPRRARAITPDAPLFAPGLDGERKDRKGKKVSREKVPETTKKTTKSVREDVTPPRTKSTRPAVSFVSPPSSPTDFTTGLLSPSDTGRRSSKKMGRILNDDVFGSSDASSSLTPLSTTKFKKFKGSEIEGIHNPFKAMRESMGAGSLLTPTKTPALKRRFQLPAEGEVEEDTVARNLFATPKKSTLENTQTVASSSKSVQKKTLGGKVGDVAKDLFGSADIFGARSPSPIAIFTDNNAKVPVYDPSPENPFVHHPPEVQKMIRKTRSQKKIEQSKKEFEQLKGNREDGMVYQYRGQTLFRKFEKDNASVLGGGHMRPRVLFPSAHKAAVKPIEFQEEEEAEEEEEEEEFDAFSALTSLSEKDVSSEAEYSEDEFESADEDFFSKTVETSTSVSTSITTVTTVEETVNKEEVAQPTELTDEDESSKENSVSEESKKSVPVPAPEPELKEGSAPEEKDAKDNELEEAVKETHAPLATNEDAKDDNKEDNEDKKQEQEEVEPMEQRGRAASVAPSVSSVASSSILSSFTRRPRITKSVSNLSSTSSPNGLRRSKRLNSAEPPSMPSIQESGKTSIKHKLSAKRGRSEDVSLEETERWALGIAGGIRKRVKNHDSA